MGVSTAVSMQSFVRIHVSHYVVKNKQALTHGNHCNAIHDVVDMCALLSADISTLSDWLCIVAQSVMLT